MEKENEENQHNHDNPGHDHQKKNPRSIIQIPSYKEVIESSHQPSQPSSLFKPSKSFSQAFSYLKSSEFYTPPPSSSSSSSSSSSLHTSKTLNAVVSRQIDQPDAPSSSSSATPAAASAALSVSSASAFSPSPSPHSVQSQNAILVSHRQKGNPLLKHIRNVRWNFADVVCDYSLGQNSCAIYISLRYHLLHPDYLYYRIRELQKNFKLRIVLCHVDVEDVVKPLLEVTRTALLHDCTLLCGWSLEECGRYLETIKVYENKPADLIQGQMDTDYLSRLSHALTAVRHVNKTDVVTLGSTFGSLSHIMDASMEDLARCPGIGERKVKRLYDTFHEPFKRVVPSRPAVPESSVQKNADPRSTNEVPDIEKEEGDASKQQKKDPELTVKSALSAALAKYADKVGKKTNKSDKGGKKTNKSSTEIGEGTGDCVEAKSENNNSSKVAAS